MRRIKWAALGATATAAAAVGGYVLARRFGESRDGLTGPAAEDATRALESGDLRWILKWVPPQDEAEVRSLFAKVLEVRAHGGDAAELADRAFKERVVRRFEIARSADDPVRPAAPPALALAEDAVDSGNLAPLEAALSASLQKALAERFARVAAARPHADENVAKGREYVAAYVDFVHLAETLDAHLGSAGRTEAPGVH